MTDRSDLTLPWFCRLRTLWSVISYLRLLRAPQPTYRPTEPPGGTGTLQISNLSIQGVTPLFRELESIQNERNAAI